jgi:hypothetical protein
VTLASETRLFRYVVYVVLLIPLVVGTAGAFGGLEAVAALFHEDRTVVLAPALRDHVRAIMWMFPLVVPLLVWALRDLPARATVVRIVLGWAACAGIARIVGAIVDGWPGAIACGLMIVELVVLPVMLVWHAALVRRSAA